LTASEQPHGPLALKSYLKKISLTLEQELVSEAREVAGPRGLSSYVNRALGHQLQHDRLAGLLDELEREAGPIDEDVMDEVRHAWPARGE
jgi:hypothetical protein